MIRKLKFAKQTNEQKTKAEMQTADCKRADGNADNNECDRKQAILAKIVRVMTVAPFMAAFMLTVIWIVKPDSYLGFSHYLYALCALTVFPLLSYPVSAIVPSLRKKGRNGQRNLAIIFSVVGYIAGILGSFIFGAGRIELLIFLTYLFSGISIALSSFVFGVKASGHACGVSGPIAMMIYVLGLPYIALYGLLGVVVWASLKIKRHTPVQLLLGSVIPVLAMLISIRLVGIWPF